MTKCNVQTLIEPRIKPTNQTKDRKDFFLSVGEMNINFILDNRIILILSFFEYDNCGKR